VPWLTIYLLRLRRFLHTPAVKPAEQLEQLSQYLAAHGVGGAAKTDRTMVRLVDKCRGVLGTLAQLLKVPLDTVVTEYDGSIRRRTL